MPRILWILLLALLVVFGALVTTNLLDSQVVTANLEGAALQSALQTKLNYSTVALVLNALSALLSLVVALLVVARYIVKWDWALKLK
jgi:hypothetical protein